MAMASDPASSEGYVELPYTLPQDSTCSAVRRNAEIWDASLIGSRHEGWSFSIRTRITCLSRVAADGKGVSRCLIPRVLTYLKTQVCQANIGMLSRRSSGTRHPNSFLQSERPQCDELASRKFAAARQDVFAVLLFSHYPADPRPRRGPRH